MLKLNSKVLHTALLALVFANALAQETLGPITGNLLLKKAFDERNFHFSKGSERAGDTLSLPFFDDFSILNSPFPDQSKWCTYTTYVNGHMPINPMSLGVVTLDGVNEMGLPYNFSPLDLQGPADTLASRPIRLAGAADTVYLSFYYQAQGRGNAPEAKDSLCVIFRDNAGLWHTVKKFTGYNLTDNKFRLAMVPVVGSQYLYDGFQFGFSNYATLSGNVDHWHIDYVTLDEGRNINDTVINDIGMLYPTRSILLNYQSIPWTHYLAATSASLDIRHEFSLRNNFDINKTVSHTFRIYDHNYQLIYQPDSISSAEVAPNRVCSNSQPNTCGAFGQNFGVTTFNWVYPTANPFRPDSNFFYWHNIFTNAADDVAQNDSVIFKQEFYNYYAYDDGTAENAYGLLDVPNGMMAYAFNLLIPDVWRGMQIYFNPVLDDARNQQFRIKAWTGNQIPEQLIYESDWLTPDYGFAHNYFLHYKLAQPVNLPSGRVFIGIEQFSGQMLNVGFDRTTNSNANMYINIDGQWSQSSIPGSWMMRPTLGADYTWTGLPEVATASMNISVYPNPTQGLLNLGGAAQNDQFELFDLFGRSILSGAIKQPSIDLNGLVPGFYVLRLTRNGQIVGTQRVCLQ